MIIGNFKYDAKADLYVGDITTMTFNSGKLEFVSNEKSSNREPDYRIVVETANGASEIGAAWKRTSEKGQEFLSVSIDDPALPGPLNAALFPAEGGRTAELVWNRPKKKAKPA